MRSIELMTRRIVGADGRLLGSVVDVRLVADGPRRGGALPSLRVEGLVVSRRRFGALWGYDRREQQGPWLLRTLLRWWLRDVRYVPWHAVVRDADGHLRATAPAQPLPPLTT